MPAPPTAKTIAAAQNVFRILHLDDLCCLVFLPFSLLALHSVSKQTKLSAGAIVPEKPEIRPDRVRLALEMQAA